jgi:hypothetical protein
VLGSRLGLDCRWPQSSKPLAELPIASGSASGNASSTSASNVSLVRPALPAPLDETIFSQFLPASGRTDPAGSAEPPESTERRLLELRLQQNYFSILLVRGQPMASAPDWREMWLTRLPALALTEDNVLYAMLTYSATNLLLSQSRGYISMKAISSRDTADT